MGTISVYSDAAGCEVSRADLEVAGDRLELRVTTLAELPTTVVRLSLRELRRRRDTDGFDRWAIELRNGRLMEPINLHVRTASDRSHPGLYYNNQAYVFAHIIVRPEDQGFEDTVIFINGPAGMEFVCNKPAIFPERVITEGHKAYWPQIALSAAPETVDVCPVEIRMAEHATCDLYPKTDLGHVPRKVRVSGGRGEFGFVPIGMRPGQQAEIKVGFAHFTNIASLTIRKAGSAWQRSTSFFRLGS